MSSTDLDGDVVEANDALVEQIAAATLHTSRFAAVCGASAQLGGRLIDSTAKKLAGEFFERLSRELAPPAEASEAAPAKGPGLWERGLSLLGAKAAKDPESTERA